MQEAFLHYVWKYAKFTTTNLTTVNGQTIAIKQLGQHNQNSGPDFFNAQITIDNQLWAGNVEIHIKSSDWYVHNHENDTAYDNVILHVVWQHDTDVFRANNTVIPTLELQSIVHNNVLGNYNNLLQSKTWINCENAFSDVDDFLFNNWLERLYIERLQQKSVSIQHLLKASQNNWEAVLFKLLCKTFGLKVNADAFASLANSFEFSVLQKVKANPLQLEAILFGQANMLLQPIEAAYFSELKTEYAYLKAKFKLNAAGVLPVQYFRLRPPNFPTIRLSQLAQLYYTQRQLFSKVIAAQTPQAIYEIFKISASAFWNTHYTFSKSSKFQKKALSTSFINLIIINTVIPLKFAYANYKGEDYNDTLFAILKALPLEKNSIITNFCKLRKMPSHAFTSQSLLQLKNEYCSKNKCLQCAIGNQIINKK